MSMHCQHDPQWRTSVNPQLTAAFGCAELHAVVFSPIGDRNGPAGNTVAVQIPEASDREIVDALRWATKRRARVLFVCNTHAQAEMIAEHAGALLLRHRRVPLERADAGVWAAS